MKTPNLIIVLMLLSIAGAIAQNPQDPLPVDPGYRVGRLDNGLTYYIRHNEEPKNQVCFHIAQKVGSMQEEENQRGLAHFLEHMAFNGSEHFPGGRMIKFLEENGIKFGAELNAYTSMEKTVYRIDNVPTNKGGFLIDSCLQILADWSGGVLLQDDEIDKERGVIKSEYLMRNSAQMRMLDSILPDLMSRTKYAYRMPIGLMSVVENFPYDDLRDYYRKWYHPSYQGIIVVGDIDVDDIEAKIKAMFSKFTNPENYAQIEPVMVPYNDEPIFATASDKEQRNTEIEIFFKYPRFPKDQKCTYAYLPYDFVESLASAMAYYRFDELAKKADSPLLYGYSSPSQYVYATTLDAFVTAGSAKPGRELEAYKFLLRESLRMAKYGFSDDEFQRTKAEILASFESRYMERDKQPNSYYVNQCISNFLENDRLTSIADDYEFAKQMLDMIPLEAVNRFVSERISTNGSNMAAFNMSPISDDQFYFTKDIYKTATQEVFAEDIEPMVQKKMTEPLIMKEPKAGKIKKVSLDKLTGARILTLSNGATVYTKKTDFKDDEILFYAHSYGGTSLYDAAEEHNLRYVDGIMANVGLGNYSRTDLRKYLAGRNVYVQPRVSLIEDEMDGNSVKKDLPYMFQLIYCYFAQPGHSTEDFQTLQQQIRQSIITSSLDPKSNFNDTVAAIRYNHNPRNSKLTPSQVDMMDFQRIQQIYKERFAEASDFTFHFVGSFDEATLDSLICKYIASLPGSKKRETFRKHTNDFNTGSVNSSTTLKMETPESQVIKYYTLQNVDYSLSNDLTFSVISQILNNRYFRVIREEQSIAYHSGCAMYLYPNEEPGKADLTLKASNPLKAEYAHRANQLMDSIMQSAIDKGFDQDELDKVRSFMIKNHEESLRQNGTWLNYMNKFFDYHADYISDFETIINSLTTDGLRKSLEEFVNASFKHTYILLPEGVEQVAPLEY